MNTPTVGFIGFGKMASAIWEGLYKQQLVSPSEACFFDISDVETKAKHHHIKYESLDELIKKSSLLFVGVKPQNIQSLLSDLSNYDLSKTCIVSILAGTPIDTFQAVLGDVDVVRVMPNTPAMLNKGMSVVCLDGLKNKQLQPFILDMFRSVGHVETLPESAFDAVTAISGSGPAFFYRYLIDIAKAGTDLGLSEDAAFSLAAHTMEGASAMALHAIKQAPQASAASSCGAEQVATDNAGLETASDEGKAQQIETLIKQVTSPGGTTFAGLEAYANENIGDSVKKVISAAHDRSVELGKES